MKGLDVFRVIAMSKTLNEASALLRLSPSAVSYNLRALEEELGLELVERKKGLKEIHLTPAGAKLLPLAIKHESVLEEIRCLKNSARSHLAIGCVESVNHCILPELLRHLEKFDIDLCIATDSSLSLLNKVENMELDIALVTNKTPSMKLNLTPLFQERLSVIRRPSSAARCRSVKAGSLNPDYEIYVNWTVEFQIWHDRVWSEKHRARFQTTSMAHIESFLFNDQCWIVAPASIARFYAKKGFYVQSLMPEPPPRTCYMAAPHAGSASPFPAVKTFLTALDLWEREQSEGADSDMTFLPAEA